jgi:hypothetical protein
MAYETVYVDGYKTQKALKEAVKGGAKVHPYTVSMFGSGAIGDGDHPIVLPSPNDRRSYGTVVVAAGVITRVK